MNIRSLLTGLNQHIAVAMRVWQPQTAALTRLELAPAMQTEPCETAVAGNARTTQIGVEQTEDLAAHHAGSGPRTGTRGLDVRVPRLLAYPHGSGIELKPRPAGQAAFIYPFATMLGTLSFLPGGLGVAEGSIAGLTATLAGADGSTAVAAALLIRAAIVGFGVLGGLPGLIYVSQRQRQPGLSRLRSRSEVLNELINLDAVKKAALQSPQVDFDVVGAVDQSADVDVYRDSIGDDDADQRGLSRHAMRTSLVATIRQGCPDL